MFAGTSFLVAKRITDRTLKKVRLSIECLEDRIVPSSDLIGLTMQGDWAIAQPSNDAFEVSSIGHWDPYGLTGIVYGDFNGDDKTDVAGWSSLGYWLVGLEDDDGQLETQQWLQGWPRPFNWNAMLVGDFDGDGNDDIAMFASTGTWWLAHSTGTQFEMLRWDQPGDWLAGATGRTGKSATSMAMARPTSPVFRILEAGRSGFPPAHRSHSSLAFQSVVAQRQCASRRWRL